MGRLFIGLVVGIGLGVVATFAVQRQGRIPDTAQRHQQMLFSTAPHFLELALPGVKTLDVSVESPSTHSVSYVYDELYDVHITYQQSNVIKQVVLPFGFSKGTPIGPMTSDFVIANDGATVVRQLTSPGSQ